MIETLRSVDFVSENGQPFSLNHRDRYRQQRKIDRITAARQREGLTSQAPVSFIIDRASPSEIEKYEGEIFEPDRVSADVRNSYGEFSNRHRALLKSLEEQRVVMIRKYGRQDVQSMPEFQELTAQFLRARDAHIAARARR